MQEKESTSMLYYVPWDVPELDPPSDPITINVTVVYARYVLKKQSAVRIPCSFQSAQPIITTLDKFQDYVEFSTFIKNNARLLNGCQNVIYFADFNDEQQFNHSAQALWAVLAEKSEVDILAVTLNTDLAKKISNMGKS